MGIEPWCAAERVRVEERRCWRLIREDLSARQSRIALLPRSLLRSARLSSTNQGFIISRVCPMSSYDPQVRHTVIIVHYQCFSSFLPFVLRLSMSSPFIFGSTRDGLPRCSYENSNAFVRRPSAVRPISSSSVPRRRDDVLFSLFWPQPSLLSSPNLSPPPPADA